MSKTPFLDFLKRLSEDPKLSERYYEGMLDVFKDTGLSVEQVRALASGERRRVTELLEKEWKKAGHPPHGGASHGVSPLNVWFAHKEERP